LLAEKKLKKTKNTTTQRDKGERKENDKDTTTSEPKKEEKGDECFICLEELPKDVTKFGRWTCCGNGMHNHCTKDLKSMKMDGNSGPLLCRAPTPTSPEETVKQLLPWVKKKKAWAQNLMGVMQYRKG